MVGLCKENHTLTEAERLLRGQRGWGLGADRCATSLRVNILYRGVLLLFVAFVWRLRIEILEEQNSTVACLETRSQDSV